MNHEPSSISKDIGSARGACSRVEVTKEVNAKDEDDFEKTFWPSYPRRKQASGALTRGAKTRAKKAWNRLKPDLRKAALEGLAAYARINPDCSPGVVDAERYLRDQRWRDADDAGATKTAPSAPIDIAWPEDKDERAFAEALIRRFGAARYGAWFQVEGAPVIRKNGAGFYLAAAGARADMIEQRHWPALQDVAAGLGVKISRGAKTSERVRNCGEG